MSARGLHVAPIGQADHPTVRDATMRLLSELGLTTIFGNPGSTELPMFATLPADFRYVLGLQESIVLGMADGFAQASDSAALVSLHSSAGVGHAMGNLFTAYRNATPLVVVAGQQARSILPHEPFLYAERATELPRPFVKWACEPARAEDVPLAIARAWHVAMQAPRGPTFVSVPIDDWERPCPALPIAEVSRRVAPDPVALLRVAAMLAGADRPVIVAGAGIAHDGARDALVTLAERVSARVWTAPMAARNPFPEDHRSFQGFLPASREAIVAALDGADLVLVVGAPAFTYHVEGDGPIVPPGARLVQLAADPAMTARLPQGLAVVGDLALALASLLADVPARPRDAVPGRRAIEPPAADRLTDALLMARLEVLRPSGIAIVEEAPSTRAALHDHFRVRAGDEFHTCASGGLGHALPAAIGIALARDDGPVLCILGDGSAMYAIQGLWSAAEYQADVRFVIVNNAGYVALDQFAALFGIDAVGSKLPGIDFVALAQAQRVPAARVTDAAALDDALRDLFDGPGPRLLEVVIAVDP